MLQGSAPGTDLGEEFGLSTEFLSSSRAGGSARERRHVQLVHEHAAHGRARRPRADVQSDAVAVRDARRGAAARPTADGRGRRPSGALEPRALDGVVRRRSERARPQLLDRRPAAHGHRRHAGRLRFPERGKYCSGFRTRSFSPSAAVRRRSGPATSGCRSSHASSPAWNATR